MKLKWLLVPMVGSLLGGCASTKREPPPPDALMMAEIPGIPDCRLWGDNPPLNEAERREKAVRQVKSMVDFDPHASMNLLAISGGAQEGAFGAGVLAGWTASGSRPDFQVVTGISSGSMLAPFAYLGPEYDFALKELFSKYKTKDVVDPRYLSAIFSGKSLSSNKKLRGILKTYFTPVEMEKVAQEYRKGRRLYVGSTHMDSIRPVIWDLGLIAASGHPDAYELIIDAILASAAFPGVFPPIIFDVEQNGKRYQELHCDGGLTSQVFAYALDTDVRTTLNAIGFKGDFNVYVLRNAVMVPKTKEIEPSNIPILRQTAFSMVNTMALMDVQYIYKDALDNGLNFYLAFIPSGLQEPAEMYDPPYMNKLYQIGFDRATAGYPWERKPLKFRGKEEQ